MKEYQNLVGSILITAAIIFAGFLISTSIHEAGGSVGSQIASAVATFMK